MRASHGIMRVLWVIGLMVLVPAASFAAETQSKDGQVANLKILRDSAKALEVKSPELAAAIAKGADRLERIINGVPPTEEDKLSKEEVESQQKLRLKRVKEAAAALSKTQPKLSKGLTRMAEHMAERLSEKKD